MTILDQVRREASSLRPGRVAATLLLALPVAAGWLAGQIVRAVWRAVTFAWSAAVVGYRAATSTKDD